ncbi:MAG: sensor domain-containing diguanylate cyclase [Lachnospiraceae bacterium]|nr:sensor domain-containing diguanylate cyclase [Lachnospiraceae bacterium]
MSNNDTVHEKDSEYESLHHAVIINEKLRPISIIMPIGVIFIIVLVMSAYTYIQKINIVKDAELVTNQMAEYIAGSIANEMEYAKSSIKLAASGVTESMTSDTLENPAEIIEPIIENTPFDGIEYIRADGMNIMNIGEPFDASDRVYYIEGIKGNTGIWNNYHPKTSQETLVNFYTPIIYKGEIAGVLTGYIAATSQIAPLFESTLYGQEIYGFLVDENNMIICSTFKTEYEKDLSLDMFMDRFGINEEQKSMISDTINNATEDAVSYDDPSGDGKLSVTTIPGTGWKVVISIPQKSVEDIVNQNTIESVIVIIIITLILVLYASYVLLKNLRRRKDIVEENAKLEEENRIFNEENKRAIKEITAIRDIIASANMGIWRIELVDGEEPRMYVDNTMKMLLGISNKESTPEETYNEWFANITPQAVASVLESVEKMEQGKFDENTYLWNHPSKGERYVRCGGTANKIPGGYQLGGYHYDVDEVVREDLAKVVMLQDALDEKNDYYSTLGTLAGSYNSMHVLDIDEDTIVEYGANDKLIDMADNKQGATAILGKVMNSVSTDESKEAALAFTDLTTLADRMQNKKTISTQLISKNIGWFLASFITMETDDKDRPTKVIFTTQSIDEEKKQEEKLINKSRTDDLTGLLNRRAYEEDIYEQNDIPANDRFVSMSLDVNGLKVVNDTLGHAAGDELLVGASRCMTRCFGSYGKIYRTGGDEFIAILFCNNEELKAILEDFDEVMGKWRGELVDSLNISYGYISKAEAPELSVRELAVIADKRMYESKAAYYRKKGVDRRGTQDAHRVLCESYTKIMKINISDDTYQIINMDTNEKTDERGFSDKLSTWLTLFGTNGQVHPDDLQEYLDKTDLNFMREYFVGNKSSLRIFYRRKYGEEYKKVMMELIPAIDYSDEEQSLYLYVKDIDN